MLFHQDECKQLEHHFGSSSNEIVVLYGDADCSLSSILQTFLKNKSYYYFRARSCSPKLQLQFFYDEIREQLPKGLHFNMRYPDILSAMLSVPCQKRLIVIEDFMYLFKSEPSVMDEIVKIIHNKWNNQSVMFLLCTNDALWVKRDMVKALSDNAYEINALIELKNASFRDFYAEMNGSDLSSAVMAYSIFGPSPDHLKMLDPAASLQENICRLILRKDSFFDQKSRHLLPDELREPSVYHTILSALALGKMKLNDLHIQTGYDRAKISVYIKNLNEHGIVEKIESFDAPGHENLQKGLYRITDPFLRFYFRFIYPHESMLAITEPERFYKKYIENDLYAYAAGTFTDVCKEYLYRLQETEDLDRSFTTFSTWYGKVGTIDIIAANEDGTTLIGYCNYSKAKMSYADYEWNRYCMSQAKLVSDILYLFSLSSFDEKIKKEAESDPSIVLIEDLTF
ncbi:MAG: hypothetical protein K6D90_03610 [Lachnospiraceae bacterium]|nr:hypothetical protein [Lachnospiraceae bacterium]